MAEIIMYTSDNCPYCRMAKQLFARRGVTVREINVDLEPAQRAEMMARTRLRSVPQIFIGTRHVGGYDALAALDRSGELQTLV